MLSIFLVFFAEEDAQFFGSLIGSLVEIAVLDDGVLLFVAAAVVFVDGRFFLKMSTGSDSKFAAR